MGKLNVKILIQTLEEEANSQCGDTPTFPHNISRVCRLYEQHEMMTRECAPEDAILEIAKTTEIQ